MKSNYLQKMTEEPVWRIMRSRKYAEQKEKEKTATHTCSISNTTNSCVKYHTDRLSMGYFLSIELS